MTGFVTAYVGIPIYFGFYLFWKVFKKTGFVNAKEADLHTGKAALDAIQWPDRVARNWAERVWFWVV